MKTKQQTTERDDIEEPEDKTPAKPVVKEDENDGTVTVDLEPARKPRKERREERQDDEVGRIRSELAASNARAAALEQQVARGFQSIEQRVGQPVEDPFKKRISSIREEQEGLQNMLRTGALTDPNAVERARKRFYELNDEADDLRDQRVVEMAARRSAPQQGQQSAAAEEALIRSEFPDVVGNQQAVRFAMGEFYRLTASGEPPTLATSRKAMQAAAEQFRLRQPALAPVPASQQQRYGAINGQAGARPAGAEIRLSKADKAMAVARWPELDEHEAYARMARTIQSIPSASGE